MFYTDTGGGLFIFKDTAERLNLIKAESGTHEAMIEVPKIKIAGYEVGPVWFTRRANKNFHELMSRFMGKQVEGAVSGNAFRFFRITVDYPKAVAVFEKK